MISVPAEATNGCQSSVRVPPPRRPPAAHAVKIVPPPKGVYVGLYSIGPILDDYQSFTVKTGHRPPLVFTFHDWVSDEDWAADDPRLRTFTDPLESMTLSPLQLAQELRKKGSVLAVAWAIQCCQWDSLWFWLGWRKPTISVSDVLAGTYDGYILKVAREIKQFGHPIMLTVFSEFNYQGMFAFGEDGDAPIDDVDHLCRYYGDPAWPDGPERIRDAFIHIIDLFRQEDVANVTWFMYAGSHYMNPTHEDYSPWLHPKYFYPGDAYIDWVGQSAYFVDPKAKSNIKQKALSTSFPLAMQPGYDAWGSVTQRPMFLPEFGPLGDGSVSRSRILDEVFTTHLPSMPRIKAVTVADFKIAADYYEVPRLGTFVDEVHVWKRVVVQDPYYVLDRIYTKSGLE